LPFSLLRERVWSVLRAMAATCASVSLLNGAVAFPPHPSSVAISQVSLVSLNSQRLQCDSIPENFNCNNKKEEFFKGFSSSPSSSSSSSSSFSSSSLCGSTRLPLFFPQRCKERRLPLAQFDVKALGGKETLRIMISGAPASGKGTQCELITAKYGLTHISAGDLLRAEVATGTDDGKKAQEYMQKGMLVPNEIVVTMVKNKLLEAVDQSGGWLLDGYPRSLSQSMALDALDIRPQLFILLDVPDEILVQRSVGRRYDPVTGKIYHLMYAPPETPEIAARLTQCLDDTEEKVSCRI
jgi:adenylate kinase